MSAGYTNTPLVQKLGIKKGSRVAIFNEPSNYFQFFNGFPSDVEICKDKDPKKDLIHYFVTRQRHLMRDMYGLKEQIRQNGMIWISWPKRSSGVETDVTEDVIRSIAVKNGLVDVKVCAINEVWSGLKLVIPAKDRK